MILYNVTVSLDAGIEQDWLSWMKETQIPDVMATGLFKETKMCRILSGEEGEISYSIQYLCESEEKYDEYLSKHALRLQRDHQERYHGKFAAFRTLLKVVHQA